MDIEAISSVKKTVETVVPDSQTGMAGDIPQLYVVDTKSAKTAEQPSGETDGEKQQDTMPFSSKEPTKGTIDSTVSEVNSRLSKTRCEYSYDEVTRRVAIKVYDKESDELIREVPPEKSLEMLQKMWELAGIVVDEKR